MSIFQLRPGRPRRVPLAVTILVLTTLLSLVRDGIAWQELGPKLTIEHTNSFNALLAVIALPIDLIYTLILFVVFWRIARGNNWARIAYLSIYLVSVLFFIALFAAPFSKVPVLASSAGGNTSFSSSR